MKLKTDSKKQAMKELMADSEEIGLYEVDYSPKPFSGDMHNYLLVNALRLLTDEQRADLCFDLYSRIESRDIVDKRIEQLKNEQLL